MASRVIRLHTLVRSHTLTYTHTHTHTRKKGRGRREFASLVPGPAVPAQAAVETDRRRRGDGLWFRSWWRRGAPPVCVFAAAHAKGVTLPRAPFSSRRPPPPPPPPPFTSPPSECVRACVPMWASRPPCSRVRKTPECCGQHTYVHSGRALGHVYTRARTAAPVTGSARAPTTSPPPPPPPRTVRRV